MQPGATPVLPPSPSPGVTAVSPDPRTQESSRPGPKVSKHRLPGTLSKLVNPASPRETSSAEGSSASAQTWTKPAAETSTADNRADATAPGPTVARGPSSSRASAASEAATTTNGREPIVKVESTASDASGEDDAGFKRVPRQELQRRLTDPVRKTLDVVVAAKNYSSLDDSLTKEDLEAALHSLRPGRPTALLSRRTLYEEIRRSASPSQGDEDVLPAVIGCRAYTELPEWVSRVALQATMKRMRPERIVQSLSRRALYDEIRYWHKQLPGPDGSPPGSGASASPPPPTEPPPELPPIGAPWNLTEDEIAKVPTARLRARLEKLRPELKLDGYSRRSILDAILRTDPARPLDARKVLQPQRAETKRPQRREAAARPAPEPRVPPRNDRRPREASKGAKQATLAARNGGVSETEHRPVAPPRPHRRTVPSPPAEREDPPPEPHAEESASGGSDQEDAAAAKEKKKATPSSSARRDSDPNDGTSARTRPVVLKAPKLDPLTLIPISTLESLPPGAEAYLPFVKRGRGRPKGSTKSNPAYVAAKAAAAAAAAAALNAAKRRATQRDAREKSALAAKKKKARVGTPAPSAASAASVSAKTGATPPAAAPAQPRPLAPRRSSERRHSRDRASKRRHSPERAASGSKRRRRDAEEDGEAGEGAGESRRGSREASEERESASGDGLREESTDEEEAGGGEAASSRARSAPHSDADSRAIARRELPTVTEVEGELMLAFAARAAAESRQAPAALLALPAPPGSRPASAPSRASAPGSPPRDPAEELAAGAPPNHNSLREASYDAKLFSAFLREDVAPRLSVPLSDAEEAELVRKVAGEGKLGTAGELRRYLRMAACGVLPGPVLAAGLPGLFGCPGVLAAVCGLFGFGFDP